MIYRRFNRPPLIASGGAVGYVFALVMTVCVVLAGSSSATTAQTDSPHLAVPAEIASSLRAAAQRGSAKVRWLGIPIYSARLFTANAAPFSWSQPFALELAYDRSFKRDRLVYASGKELERLEGDQADHPDILSKLQDCYRTVSPGDRFVAFGAQKDRVDFLFNGRKTCELRHPDIRKRLLSIWMSDQSRDPKLSSQLRGQ